MNTINYGEHRHKWLNELKSLFNATSRFDIIDYRYILKVYTILQNYGIYTNYEPKDVIKWYEDNQKDFIMKINDYLTEVKNKKNVAISVRVILDCIQKNVKDFNTNGYYLDFLDDIKSEIGLIAKQKYNNFIGTNLYDNMDEAYNYYIDSIKQFKELKNG